MCLKRRAHGYKQWAWPKNAPHTPTQPHTHPTQPAQTHTHTPTRPQLGMLLVWTSAGMSWYTESFTKGSAFLVKFAIFRNIGMVPGPWSTRRVRLPALCCSCRATSGKVRRIWLASVPCRGTEGPFFAPPQQSGDFLVGRTLGTGAAMIGEYTSPPVRSLTSLVRDFGWVALGNRRSCLISSGWFPQREDGRRRAAGGNSQVVLFSRPSRASHPWRFRPPSVHPHVLEPLRISSIPSQSAGSTHVDQNPCQDWWVPAGKTPFAARILAEQLAQRDSSRTTAPYAFLCTIPYVLARSDSQRWSPPQKVPRSKSGQRMCDDAAPSRSATLLRAAACGEHP